MKYADLKISPSELAIVQKSQSRLQELLDQIPKTEDIETYIGHRAFSFARNWGIGLGMLFTAGARPYGWSSGAFTHDDLIGHAIQTDSLDLVNLCLVFGCPLTVFKICHAFKVEDEPNSIEIRKRLVTAFASGRRSLRVLAKQYLSHQELSDLNLVEELPDQSYRALFLAIRRKGLPLPKNSQDPSHICNPIYHDLARHGKICLDSDLSTCADSLYAEGFHSINVTDADGLTPIQESCLMWNVEMIRWLAQKGVDPLFRDSEDDLYCLHYLAGGFGANGFTRESNSLLPGDRQRKALDTILRIKDLDFTSGPYDRCLCYCSPQGCSVAKFLIHIPLRERWVIQSSTWCYFAKLYRAFAVQLKIPYRYHDSFLAAMTRILLFDRLGMAHTCCCFDYRNLHKRTVKDPDEILELRSEDEEMARELDQWMERYEDGKMSFRGNRWRFWARWWKQRDQDLPSPPDERKYWYSTRNDRRDIYFAHFRRIVPEF
jgi:hypothetical protein